MTRHILGWATLTAILGASTTAFAQIPFSFKFKEGVPLVYRTVHDTTVEVKQGEETAATASTVKQLKRWDVQKVDSLGVATIEMSIQELSLEQTEPNGDSVKFDSQDIEGSTPELAEQLKPVVGRPIIQVQIDGTGAVKAYKHLTQREDILRELPFQITVPSDKIPTVGMQWRRDFPIQLEPPVATPARTLRAVQFCTVKKSDSSALVVDINSELLEDLKDPKQMIPVLQFLPAGQATLDPLSGRLVTITMTIDKTVPNFQGDGSYYKFKSKYSETLVDEIQQADKRDDKRE